MISKRKVTESRNLKMFRDRVQHAKVSSKLILLILTGLSFFACINFVINTREKIDVLQKKMETFQFTAKDKIPQEQKHLKRKSSSHSSNSKQTAKPRRVRRSPNDNVMIDETMLTEGKGVVYTRWGRHDCSGPNNDLIYEGIAAGAHYTHTGGVSDSLCLHLNVSYRNGRFQDGNQGASHIYGLEYRDSWISSVMDFSLIETHSTYLHSVPCAVCLVERRTTQLMIPGRVTCPQGWTKEYTGYIMAGGHSDKHATSPICVDDTPQVVPGTHGSQNGAFLHMVETQCASLLCEPYAVGREISCVVCTL
ncbi:uncharacterized protein LOC143465891 isoform X1 [Clavelina lepadiformis]|uniref:uncharacterized protein LOC143465891 isoform X1 n=1 Tax=Clavelina lepadiformis TaxID=159417 RepID=UPI004041BA7C